MTLCCCQFQSHKSNYINDESESSPAKYYINKFIMKRDQFGGGGAGGRTISIKNSLPQSWKILPVVDSNGEVVEGITTRKYAAIQDIRVSSEDDCNIAVREAPLLSETDSGHGWPLRKSISFQEIEASTAVTAPLIYPLHSHDAVHPIEPMHSIEKLSYKRSHSLLVVPEEKSIGISFNEDH